jgi:hypothetical protein
MTTISTIEGAVSTREEIEVAFEEYHSGTFIKYRGKG